MKKDNPNQRVLILAPIGQDARVMAELLARHGFQTQICKSMEDCCAQMKSGAGALVLTEEAFELPNVSEFLQTLNAQPPWSELPITILTTGGESRLVRLLELTAEAAGTVTLLERPIGTSTLVRSLEVALNSRRRQYQVRDLLEEQRHNEVKLWLAHEQLADRARQLEDIVELRTAKLVESNEQLRREIAERQQAEAAREALHRKLLHAQEEERRRIARELHDQLGQNLTVLNFALESLLHAEPSSAN
jgi:DNA-binding NtrC family response regulator